MKTSVTFKAAVGYGIVAIVLALSLWLVYANTRSLLAASEASRQYTIQQEHMDSLVSELINRHNQLADLTARMPGPHASGIHRKVEELQSGADSVVAHQKTAMTHEDKSTVMEVVKTRKGFFNRLADAFRGQRTDTVVIKQKRDTTVVDTIATPVDVSDEVVTILSEIERDEHAAAAARHKDLSRRTKELQRLSATLTARTDSIIHDIQHRDRNSSQLLLEKIQHSRQRLLWQLALLAGVAIATAAVLLAHILRDSRRAARYQESLRIANDEAHRLMEQRERLLLTITHDIKAPAASITGFIDLLRERVTDKESMECLDSIRHSSTHLSRLVASLLDYHQLEKGSVQPQPTAFDPVELIKQCVIGMRPRAAEKGLEVAMDTSAISMEKGKACLADAFRIRQILDNLVVNAIKYTAHGGVTVKGSLRGDRLLIAVIDTGQGMTAEESRRIFHAFTRLKGAQGTEGVGLGLSITRELVTLLGGDINLRTAKGRGSTFTITLPVAFTAAQSDSPCSVLFGEAKEPENHKILLLDDDKLQLLLLEKMLSHIGGGRWQVFSCNYVADALTVIHEQRPAYMLMDIEMPEMNGTDFIRHINHSGMTVIAMTAHDSSIRRHLEDAGFDGCLFKPFGTAILAALLGDSCDTTTGDAAVAEGSDSRLATLLAFADGDKEAEDGILHTVLEGMETHLHGLMDAVGKVVDIHEVGRIAHKLLPIAAMAGMESAREIETLAPERIEGMTEEAVRTAVGTVVSELEMFIAIISRRCDAS